MSVLFKSTRSYAGSGAPVSVSEATMLAADIYTSYAARVVADGGAVQDSTACLAAITAALAGGYFYLCPIAVSPRWGIKTSGATITKFYNLADSAKDGTVSAGVIDLDTTHRAWTTAKFDNAADTITFSNIVVNKTGKFGFIGSCGDHGNATTGIVGAFTPAAEAWTFRDADAKVIVNGIIKIDYDTVLPDNAANGVFVEQTGSGGTMTIVLDGLQNEVTTGMTFTNLANNASAATYTLKADATLPVYMNEWWHMNNATRKAMVNLAYDLGARY